MPITIKTEASDLELVKEVKGGDSEAFKEICRRYENIFYKICQKYITILANSGVNPQDIFDEKNYIIYHCVSTFKPSKKTKLSTWIGNYARYLCLNSINARRFILPSNDEDIKKYIEETVKPFLIGKNPFDVVDFLTGPGPDTDYLARASWAGLNNACWDIVGKAKGMPVYKLLAINNEPKTRMPIYASGGVEHK